MRGWKIRGFAAVLAAASVSAVGFATPGAASAACAGANIEGNGASVEANAHKEAWEPTFNKKCAESKTEQVTYLSTSSNKGLESWGVLHLAEKFKGFGVANAFVAADDPPNAAQEAEILEEENPASGAKVLTIPVLQYAVAIAVHLPEGCTAEGGKKGAVKRLILSDATLQGIFAHTITKWEQVPGVVGASCNKSAPIVRVVRKEGSGSTSLLEKFLFEINKEDVVGSETWNQLAEHVENITWPDEGENLLRAEKGSGIASTVAKTAGTIGFANLNEVRQNAAFTPTGGGGSGTSIFWPELDSKGTKYQDPSTDLEENAAADANCAGETYITLNASGKAGKFPPPSTEATWNEVTASTTQKASYPLCGFTFDLSLTDFANFSEEKFPTSAAEVETVEDYLGFAVSTEGQNALDEKHDFFELPNSEAKKGADNVDKIAQEGVAKIAY